MVVSSTRYFFLITHLIGHFPGEIPTCFKLDSWILIYFPTVVHEQFLVIGQVCKDGLEQMGSTVAYQGNAPLEEQVCLHQWAMR